MDFNESIDFGKLYEDRDEYIYNKIENLLESEKVDIKIILQNYMSFTPCRQIRQTLAYYEIFKKVMSLPGSIAEVGVFFGNGLFTWAKLLEIFFPNNRTKKVYGFDNFSGYSQEISEVDKNGIEYIAKRYKESDTTVFKANREVVEELIDINKLDNLIMGINRVVLHSNPELDLEGNIREFLKRGGVRLCLMIVDVNLYKPTAVALELLYQRLVCNGLIILRGYGTEPWEGESLAVDEFMKKHKEELVMEDTYAFSMYPAIILRKEVSK